MTKDWQEEEIEDIERRHDPKRSGDVLERIEWKLMYGEYGTPLAIKVIGYAVVALLCAILWRIW